MDKKYFWEKFKFPVQGDWDDERRFFTEVLTSLDDGTRFGWSLRVPGINYSRFNIRKKSDLYWFQCDVEDQAGEDKIFHTVEAVVNCLIENTCWWFLEQSIEEQLEGGDSFSSGSVWLEPLEKIAVSKRKGHDTIGRLKDGRYFWTWDSEHEGKAPPEMLLDEGDRNSKYGGRIYSELYGLYGFFREGFKQVPENLRILAEEEFVEYGEMYENMQVGDIYRWHSNVEDISGTHSSLFIVKISDDCWYVDIHVPEELSVSFFYRTIAECREFLENDPYEVAGYWGTLSIYQDEKYFKKKVKEFEIFGYTQR